MRNLYYCIFAIVCLVVSGVICINIFQGDSVFYAGSACGMAIQTVGKYIFKL